MIILTWNRSAELLLALASVYRQEYERVEVVVVDSASTDGTREAVLSQYPEVKYVRLPYNVGVAGGRNIGIANADGDMVFLLDDDAELLDSDAVSQVVRRFSIEPELAVMFFRYVLANGQEWGWVLPFAVEPPLAKTSLYTSTFVGCAHCVRREWIERVGYLKADFVREGEEADFAYRVYRNGGRVLYYPHVNVLHHLNPSGRVRVAQQAFKLAHRTENDLVHLPLRDSIPVLLWRLASGACVAAKQGWFSGYVSGCWKLVKAAPRILRSRRPLDGETAKLVRTLNSYAVVDFDKALGRTTSFLDWAAVRRTRRPLGVLASGACASPCQRDSS